MTGFHQRANIYVCDTCKGHIVTRDRDQGVTPFMVDCRAKDGCKGMMQSSMYRVFDQTIGEDHEWYRPNKAEYDAIPSAYVREHVDKGGLLLRKVGTSPVEGDALTEHAKALEGPTNCNIWKREHGHAVLPRTCGRCRLGPCPFFDKEGRKL